MFNEASFERYDDRRSISRNVASINILVKEIVITVLNFE